MWTIATEHVSAVIAPTGAMLHDVAFRLPDGRSFAPFAKAPWFGEPVGDRSLPGHLGWLGAEFVCVPFGVGGRLDGISLDWQEFGIEAANDPPHGRSANAVWEAVAARSDCVWLSLDYPPDHGIRQLQRVVRACTDRPALDFTLLIESRRSIRISVGLHPILSLDVPPAALVIQADFELGLTYPATVPGNCMATARGQVFSTLRTVPSARGATVDLSRLPLATPVEDVLLLCGMQGPVVVAYTEQRVSLRIDWDRTALPHCNFWISDRALQHPPWNGRYRGIGIEPIAAAFDFADSVSTAENPVTRRGYATSLTIHPETPVEIRYRLDVVPD